MKFVLGAAMFAVIAGTTPTLADDVPCENMLKDLRTALQSSKPSDADAAKIKELEDKGIERCNADDDARADQFFAQALKILGK